MRTGIMGGTFDPIHIGHLYLAHEAKEVLNLDRIIFIPSGKGPHKAPSTTPKTHRLMMVQAAIADWPYFECSDMEIQREGFSYTIDTFKALEAAYPMDTFYFITGADAFMGIVQWKDYKELLSGMHFVAAYRPSDHMDASATMAALQALILKLEAGGARSVSALPILGLDIASSEIRKRLAAGRNVHCLVPESVHRLIVNHHLYRANSKQDMEYANG